MESPPLAGVIEQSQHQRAAGSASCESLQPSSLPGRTNVTEDASRFDRRWFALLATLLIGCALVLRRASLRAGWFVDDYVQHSLLTGNAWFRRGMWDLHVAARGDDAAELIRNGALPWWSEPTMVFAPLRPFTSLLMWWEYHYFGKDPVALHAVSFVLWASFAALTLTAYAGTLPRRAAIIGSAVFVLSPVHSESVSWVASQSLLVSAVFGALSLNFYAAFRRSASLWQGFAHVLTYICALLGGESGLGFVGYFCAHALFCSRDSARTRAASLAPVALASVAYLSWSAVGGYGMRGVSHYANLPSPLHLWHTMRASIPAHIVQGLAGPVFQPGEPGMVGWALATLMLAWALLRGAGLVSGARPVGSSGRVACAWLIGALLATAPYGAAAFSTRLGAIPAMGFAAALGLVLDGLLDRLRRSNARILLTWAWAAAFAYLFVAHVAYAGYESHATTRRIVERYGAHAARAARAPVLGVDGRKPPSHVFLMSALHVPIAQTIGLARVAQGQPLAAWRVLSPASGPHFLIRTSDRSFVLHTTSHGIFVNLSTLVYRKLDSAIEKGTTIQTDELSVRVLESGNAGPYMMEFTFDEPLESPRYRFAVATPGGFVAYEFPAPGQSGIVPPALPPEGLIVE